MSLKINKRIINRILFLFLYLVFFLTGILIIQKDIHYTYDALEINRIVDTIEHSRESLEAGSYDAFSYPFIVIDSSQKPLFSHGNPESITLQDAMRHSDVILPVQLPNQEAGTVIIGTHIVMQQHLKQLELRFITITGTIFFLGLLILFLYDMHLYRNILKPFQKLVDFAKKISYGDYSTSLKLSGNKDFYPLIEQLNLMQDELRCTKQREYEANQSKKALVASLSHDIKTPITSIQLAVELLEVKVSDNDIKECLKAIQVKTLQINQLVSDLFHTTLEDLEELPVSPKECYSHELIALFKDADLNHSIHTLEIPDCMILMDSVRMEQIFTNIIYNSYKYAKSNIDITGTITPESLLVSIRDYGPGVASQELPCIFNRFYRGSNVGTESGSGLGLYICKCLIEKMDGSIYCHNHEHGLETIIEIPLA